ncbi:hypothetical protein CORC01_11638 [Colletotrichum orchidophilum]|uniref:Uncharacterized protein n=1 Tax=Colletotrichum orchidophilum TaxID=1209926 RepID=A0A1G4AVE1_9PEZI|nr:uncharacterized protein CORC01_11638 [Colletotrichum orchidophilum]OHE93081.1 hypothetical protein CORC01_11638 [Colletotrichum orchidophilum]
MPEFPSRLLNRTLIPFHFSPRCSRPQLISSRTKRTHTTPK